MSGGSYNYLCFAAARDIPDRVGDLKDMADALFNTEGGINASNETLAIVDEIKAFEDRLARHALRLSSVWKAIEWERSGDTGPEDTQKALEEYNQR